MLTSSLVPRRLAAAMVCLLAALAVLVMTAGPAAAHASVEETSPFDGQNLPEAPDEVSWRFNEPVTSTPGALRVFDAAGERVDTSEQGQPAADELVLGLRDDIGAGSYIATYRVTSADGHVIRGAFVFTVGEAGEVDDDTLAAIFGGGGDTALGVAAGAARAMGYGGALLVGGALVWSVAVARSRRDPAETGSAVGDLADTERSLERGRAATWARRGAIVTAIAAVVVLPAQAMLTSGLGVSALTSGAVMGETLTSSVGIAALVRLVAAVAVLALLARGGERAGVPVGLAGLVMLGSFLIDGHTRTVEPAWLLYLGDAVHLLAGAAWFGGLVLLVQTVRAMRFDDDPVGAADVVSRFSRVATWALVAVTVAGLAMSWALVRQPRALTTTEFGWTLLAKVALVAVVILVGVYNNRRLVPAIQRVVAPAGGAVDTAASATDPDARARIGRAAWGQLRRTARFEVGVLVAVLAVTAFLVNLRPAAEDAGITSAFDTLVTVNDDLQLNLVVDPNRVGQNEIHFYLLDETGRPVSDIPSVTAELTQPARDIGPIVREPFVAGPGHWQISGNDLAVPGEWIIELVLGLDRFTEVRVEVPVVVNP